MQSLSLSCLWIQGFLCLSNVSILQEFRGVWIVQIAVFLFKKSCLYSNIRGHIRISKVKIWIKIYNLTYYFRNSDLHAESVRQNKVLNGWVQAKLYFDSWQTLDLLSEQTHSDASVLTPTNRIPPVHRVWRHNCYTSLPSWRFLRVALILQTSQLCSIPNHSEG